MKEIQITCTWESSHWVEVEDNFEVPSNLGDFPEEVLEELTPVAATLIDWR